MEHRRQTFGNFLAAFRKRFILAARYLVVTVVALTAFGVGVFYGVPYLVRWIYGNPPASVSEEVSVSEPVQAPEEKVPQAKKPANYPVQKLRDRGVKNTPKFEILTREGINVIFFKKDGAVTGSMIRVMDDELKQLLVLPNDQESCAVVFPVRHESECQFQTKNSAGEFKACSKFSTDKFGPDQWSIKVACFDM